MNDVLRHGDVGRRENSAPRLGPTLETSKVTMGLLPNHCFEVHFRPPRDVVTIALGCVNGVRSYDSDKTEELIVRPGMIALNPKGSVTYVDGHDVSGECIVLEIPTSVRTALAHEKGLNDHILNQGVRDCLRSPLAIPLAQKIRNSVLGGDADQNILAENFAVLVMSEILDEIAARPPCAEPNTCLSQALLTGILDYIEENLAYNMSLTEIAKTVDLSPYHLARCFKQEMHMSPHQYVLERRVVRAREFLEQRGSSLADIAYAVGFSSQAHMTDVFRKRLGVTPGAYRREFKP